VGVFPLPSPPPGGGEEKSYPCVGRTTGEKGLHCIYYGCIIGLFMIAAVTDPSKVIVITFAA